MNPNYSIKDITNSHIINESDSYTVTADLNDTNMKTVLNSINIGDVIVSNIEPIFFKKVTAIDKVDDNNFIFETEFIPLEEVVQEGYLSGSSAFATNSNPSTKRTKTQFISRNGKKIPLNSNEKGEYKLYFGKKNQQKSLEVSTVLIEYDQIDGVKIKGSVKINPKFDLDMDWSLFGGLEYLRIAPGFKITPGIELVIEKELAGFGGTQNDKYLGSISHTQIFPVGIIPVSVTEDIKLYVGAEGSVKGVITVGAEVSIDQTYILTWSKKSGLHFNPVFNQTTGSLKLPEIKVEGEAGAYVKVEPGIRVYIIGVGVANKIGIYGQLGAKTGSMINFTGNDVDVDVAKVYYELFLKYQPQFTLSVPAVFANNEFVKGLKHDFESKFPPIAEIKYTLAKKEFGALDQVIPLKPGELKVIGYNYTEDFKNNQIVNESITYQLENIGQQDLYWSASLHGELLEGINIFPKSGKLAPNDKTDILVDIGLNDLSTIIGENKSVLCFYSSDEQIIEWHSPMVIPDNYDDLILPKFSYSIALNVHPVLDPLNNAILLTDGDSYKKITIQYDEPTNDVDGYIIYKADYNSEDNYCYENYNRFAKVNDKTQNKYSFLLETSINSLDINKKMDIGHSYCFNMASFKEINNFYSESPFMQTDLILNVPNYATLKSNITDQNNNAIENVMIYLTSLSDNTITDGLGNYTFDQLLPGNYKVIVEAEGYIRVEGDVTLESGEIKIFERQLVVSEDLEDIEGTVKGKVQNALDGSGVPNATISIRKGINITSGEFIKTITTDSNGYYSTILVTGGYTFSIEAENYAVTHPTVYSFGNSVTTKDLTLSPILSVGNMRIVLSWGMNPLDLDSHLVKKVNGSQEYHIYYSDQSGTNGDNLDHDDVESYGPETVTIENVDPGADYYYFVKQFSDDSNLKSSSAKVEVYYGNSHFIYNVPNEDGIYWEVFEIQNGNIIPCTSNCIVDDLDFIETRNFKRKKDSLPAF
ncbi:hypothetical protein MHK_001970 [Candidatus Magnetomorum sp. HK-1]|nr:hypothetical protein MHK_001970 [Candidatus Magnetomorum sp. HK-1]